MQCIRYTVPALQITFAQLALSIREYFIPDGFWRAFKDYDGESINIREHQDGYEFFTRLQVCMTEACAHDAVICTFPRDCVVDTAMSALN